MTEPFRLQPSLPAAAVKTYQLLLPATTHFRPARCEEVDCSLYRNGFTMEIDLGTELGYAQFEYLRRESRRQFTREYRPGGTNGHNFAILTFPPGQQCFNEHQTSLEREPIPLVRGGDWRGDPRGDPVKRHHNLDDWVDDFATHQQKIHDRIERG